MLVVYRELTTILVNNQKLLISIDLFILHALKDGDHAHLSATAPRKHGNYNYVF